MRPKSAHKVLFAWITLLALSWAGGAESPDAIALRLTATDADVIVTDVRGVIVGVGRVVAGAAFELQLLEGFVGAARLTVLRLGGATETLGFVVGDRITVEGLDLLDLLDAWVGAFTVEVGGVAHRQGERRADDAEAPADDAAAPADDGPGHGRMDPSGPPETTGPPESAVPPGTPGSHDPPGEPDPRAPRGPEGRP